MPVAKAGSASAIVEVNGRSYAVPNRPTVVIVVDGFDPVYLERGFANGTLPTLKPFSEHGFVGIADCSMPSTTNINNTSIVTGVPPAVHGINGNYYLDPETGNEIMISRGGGFVRTAALLSRKSHSCCRGRSTPPIASAHWLAPCKITIFSTLRSTASNRADSDGTEPSLLRHAPA